MCCCLWPAAKKEKKKKRERKKSARMKGKKPEFISYLSTALVTADCSADDVVDYVIVCSFS